MPIEWAKVGPRVTLYVPRYVQNSSLKIYDKWRPILIFVNGPMPSLMNSAMQDWIQGKGSQKELHDWQQSLDEVKFYVETFTGPGDLTIDLCGGSFTTAHAVKKLGGGRKFVGCDVSQDCVNIGKHRLGQLPPPSIGQLPPPSVLSA